MTNIELQFFESAIRYFRENKNHQPEKKIDWEQRRYEIAAMILAGKASNHQFCTQWDVADSVQQAEKLIEKLQTIPLKEPADENR